MFLVVLLALYLGPMPTSASRLIRGIHIFDGNREPWFGARPKTSSISWVRHGCLEIA